MAAPVGARALAGIMPAAPAAAERARKSRRVGDDDVADMAVLRCGREGGFPLPGQRVALFLPRSAMPDQTTATWASFGAVSCMARPSLGRLMRCGFDLRSTAERRSRPLGSAQESQDGIRRIGCGVAILAGDQSAIAHDMKCRRAPLL